MKITIAAVGTRGDVQPMIALGQGLQANGHSVRILAGSNFETWVRGYGFDFIPTVDMEALMQSPKGVLWTQSSDKPMKQLQMMSELLQDYEAEMITPLIEGARNTELLISVFVSEPFTQAIGEKFGIPVINAPLQPYRPTRSGPASLIAPVRRGSSPINWLMGAIGERMMWSMARKTANKMRTVDLGLPAHTARTYTRAAHATPTMFGFSRYVVPPPAEWGDNTEVTGYWFLDEDTGWTPPAALMQFLDSGQPPVYIGFGSMSSADPQATLNLIVEAVRRSGQRAVVASGWGRLNSSNVLPESIYLLDKAPHNWLFPRVAAVVHHGGAGTTAAGLRAGKPTMIIPHMSDQPFWGRRVEDLGVGVPAVPRHQLTADILTKGLTELATNASLTAAATTLGANIRAEQGVANAVRFVERWSRLG